MPMKSQGTQIYIIDPEDDSVLNIPCATSLSGISAGRDQLESTCLEAQARTYEAGLATPGQASFSLYFDPKVPSHERIYELWQAGTKFDMAVGFSDGTAAPTVDTAGDFDLPTTRSWVVLLDCYFADVPLDAALNSLLTANVTVQLSGFPTVSPKA